MRTVLVVLLVVVSSILFVGSVQMGITPSFVLHGADVATGISAKLLCSEEYVMGSSREQAFTDITQYSPLLEEVTVAYDPAAKAVSSSFLGLSEAKARFLPGIGCALEFSPNDPRTAVNTRVLTQKTARWPAGNRVDTINAELQDIIEQRVTEDNSAGFNTRALLVVHRGEILAEAYGQGATHETQLLGWSMAKSMTAIMLGNLEYRGLIDLTAPAPFSSWSGDDRASVRIDHLLTMTDGLDFNETYQPGSDATTMLFEVPSAADYALESHLAHEPGSHFNYSSGTANLLAKIYLDTLGTPQAAYDHLMDNLFGPMAMQNATFEMDASGNFVGSSYLYASARDWARMGQLMLNGGSINSQRLVSEDWVKRATTPNGSDNEHAYGYQWWLNRGNDGLRFPDLPADAYFANGNRQQTVMVFPSQQTVIVRLGWTSGWYPVDIRFGEILALLGA